MCITCWKLVGMPISTIRRPCMSYSTPSSSSCDGRRPVLLKMPPTMELRGSDAFEPARGRAAGAAASTTSFGEAVSSLDPPQPMF